MKQEASVNLIAWLILAAWFHRDDQIDRLQNSRSASFQ